MNDNETKKISKKGNWVTAAFFAFSLVVVAIIAIIEFGGEHDRHIEQGSVNGWFIFPAIGCFLVGLLCEGIKYEMMLREKGYKKNARSLGFSCAVIGKYYDNLTPAGAGGQGFQMYQLKKNGCDDGTAGSLPIVGFLGLQFAFVFLGIITMAFGGRYLSDELLAIKITAIVGLIFYAFVPMCIIFFAVAPRTLESIVRSCTKLLYKIRIIKNADKAVEKAVGSLQSYSDALRNFGKNIKMLVLIFVISLVYQIAFMSLPFFVLHIFGSTIDFVTCFFRVVYIYAAITIIFTPGNSGAAEASFYMVFNSLSGGAVFWGMLVWRALCYYSWIVCGAIIQFRERIAERESKRWHKLPVEEGSAGLFVDIYYPNIDGVVTTVNAYASNIPGSFVVAPGSPRASIPLCSYDIAWLKEFGGSAFQFAVPMPAFSGKAKKYIRNHRVSVYHAHSPFMAGRMALKYGKRYGVPVVATFHSKYYDDFMNITHSKLISRLFVKYYIVPFYEKCDTVWACSKSTAVTLKEYGYTGKVGVMENGTDMTMPEDRNEIRAEARALLKIPEDAKVVSFVGQLVWHKNLKLILDTIKVLKDKGTNVWLLAAGEGYNGTEIREYCTSLGLEDLVKFVGKIDDRGDLKKVYIASDLFFFPSKYDNAPVTVREAAALGVPSLLLEGSNAAEILSPGKNGFVGPDDSEEMAKIIIKIFASHQEKEIGEYARTTIPESWSEVCGRAKAKYGDIAAHYSK